MFENIKGYFELSKMWGGGGGIGSKTCAVRKYTPLYEKGTKKLGIGQWRLLYNEKHENTKNYEKRSPTSILCNRPVILKTKIAIFRTSW